MDFEYRETQNELHEIEWMGGDSEMMEEEYEEGFYRPEQLHPVTGGMRFEPRMFGDGYSRDCQVPY